ncbi:G8 domain-containing protein [Halovulum sp. GXIMD14794]
MADILWSQLRMQDGARPGAEDVIVVSSDDRLIFDSQAGPTVIKGLVIYGEFIVEDSDTELSLTTDWAVALDGGVFRVGTEDDPYAGKFNLTLAGKDNSNDVDLAEYPDAAMAGMKTMATGHGGEHRVIQNNNAFLMAMGEGSSIEVHVDDAAKASWTQLGTTAQAGDKKLTFVEATGWQPGDKIAIASTDFDLNQAETFTISHVLDGGKTVILDQELEFMHYGDVEHYDNGTRAIDMRAEVALLSRDVTIKGDVKYDEQLDHNQQVDQYGGHVMVMMGGEMRISGAELAHMGQAGVLGRYPAHWHLSEDASGQYIENSSIHHSFNNGLTVHGTENARVENNAIFETVGHGVFLEDGSEIGNEIAGNLAFNQRKPGLFDGSPGGDQDKPASFWIENSLNTISGNHAAGSEDAGFYFDLQKAVDYPSRSIDSLADNASREGPSDMVGNSVHSSDRGFYLDHRSLVRDHEPYGDASQPQKVAAWTVEDFTAYKIGGHGIYVRGIEGTFVDVKMAEVSEGTRFRLNQAIEGGLIVGRSQGNTGTPTTEDELAEGRSLPNGNGDFTGHLLYDGPGGISNVHFDGFFSPSDHAIGVTGAVHKSSVHYVKDLSWGSQATMLWEQRVDFGVFNPKARQTAEMLVDLDGSLSGIVGGAILNDQPEKLAAGFGFYRSNGAIVFDEWGAVASPFTDIDFIALMNVRVVDENGNYRGDNTPYDVSNFEIDVLRNDGALMDGLFVGPGVQHRQTAIVEGYTYEMTIRGEPPQFQFMVSDMPEGESAVYKIDGLRLDSSFYLNNPNTRENINIKEVSSIGTLLGSTETTIFRDISNSETYIKFVSEMFHGYDFAMPQETRGGVLTGGVVVNVDQRESSRIDLDLIEYDEPEMVEISGTLGDDQFRVTSEINTYSLGGGSDYLMGNVEDFFGDIITDLGIDDVMIFEGDFVQPTFRRVGDEWMVVDIAPSGPEGSGGSIVLEGEFDRGEFIRISNGANTHLMFENYLPELASKQSVPEEILNGNGNRNFFKSDGETAFAVSAEHLGRAGNDNSIGVYEITSTGDIVNERILFNNIKEGGSVILDSIKEGHELGFFLVQDGADRIDGWIAEGDLDFVDARGRSAGISDGPLFLSFGGNEIDEMVFHSLSASMNADGIIHAVSGLSEDGLGITIGFEDRTRGGDRDYEDAGITVVRIDDDFIL